MIVSITTGVSLIQVLSFLACLSSLLAALRGSSVMVSGMFCREYANETRDTPPPVE